jgi:hypothetical protein
MQGDPRLYKHGHCRSTLIGSFMAKPLRQKSRTQILEDITSFVARHKSHLCHWYVGTTEDARRQLFKIHGFKETDVGLFRQAASSADAASIADLLIGRGARGDRGEKPGAKSIYVFKLTKHSTPSTL